MEFQLIRSDRKTISLEIKNGQLIVHAPRGATNQVINDCILKNQAWIEKHLAAAQERQKAQDNVKKLTMDEVHQLADKALKIIPERVQHYAPLVGVTYGNITIRNQRTRWGSCSSQGNLNFNCLLVLAPPEVLDSVVVHELCHRKEMNHSAKFYAEVRRVMPDYDKWHGWLKENGSALMSMMP